MRYIIAALMIIVLAGCSFETPDFVKSIGEVKSSPEESKPLTYTVKQSRLPSDLEDSSASHEHQLGDMVVTIDYWTELPAKEWDGSSETINVNLSVDRSAKTDVKITRFYVESGGTDLWNETGEFIVTPPFSYTVPILTPEAEDKLSLKVHVDFIIETKVGSGQYFRQALVDELDLTFGG